jgi:hypothetical protein
MTIELSSQEPQFLVRREVHPRCKGTGIKVFHSEDGSDMFFQNIGAYITHKASSYPNTLQRYRRKNNNSYTREDV